jgi:hypothetical protein
VVEREEEREVAWVVMVGEDAVAAEWAAEGLVAMVLGLECLVVGDTEGATPEVGATVAGSMAEASEAAVVMVEEVTEVAVMAEVASVVEVTEAAVRVEAASVAAAWEAQQAAVATVEVEREVVARARAKQEEEATAKAATVAVVRVSVARAVVQSVVVARGVGARAAEA